MSLWRSYDATHGLYGGVRTLHQDRKGYLWIGTRNAGLFRFDGSQFDHFTLQDGLPHNCIENILEDEQGGLWLATSNGLSYFDGHSFTNYGTEHGLPHPFLWWLCRDKQGRLWCTTRAGVACEIEPGRFKTYSEADGLGSPRVGTVGCDSSGVLWFGTFGGLTSFDGTRFINRTIADGLVNNDVGCLLIDHNDHIWCGTRNGLSCFDGERFTNYNTQDGLAGVRIMSLYEDREGRIWCGHNGYGISCWDGAHFTIYGIRDGLSGAQIRAMVQDQEGVYYFGALDAGLSRFDPQTIRLLSETPCTGGIQQINDGEIRYAYRNTVCSITLSTVHCRSFPDNVHMVIEDTKGRTTVYTSGGCYRFHSNESLMNPASMGEDSVLDPKACFEGTQWDCPVSPRATRDGSLWYSSALNNNTVYRFDHGIQERITTNLESAVPLFEDRQGRLWIGDSTGRRLVYYQNGVLSQVFQDITPEMAGDDLGFRCGIETRDGLFWLGTSCGLAFFDPEQLLFIDSRDTYGNLCCSCITIDASEMVWVGTLGGGVYRFKDKVCQKLTMEDGLPSNTIAGFAPQSDGTMIIGTLGGLIHYKPTATTPPCVEIVELVADRAYACPENVELSREAACHITISFRSLALSTLRMNYAFMLEPLDSTWRYTQNDSVRYENLPLGQYTFRVMTYNRDLVASLSPATISLSVLPSPTERRIEEYARQLNAMVQELELQTRVREQNRVLVDLARRDPFKEDNTQAALHECANVAASTLRMARVSIWLSNNARTGLNCVYYRDIRSDFYDTPAPLNLDNAPTFYAFVKAARILVIPDVTKDTRVAELETTYLRPNGVVALLGAPLRMGGKTIGLLLCEQIGQPREFSLEEQYFVTSLADLFSLMWNNAERRRAEKALRESEERFRGTFEQAAVGICHVAADKSFLRVNQKFCEIVGYTQDDLRGMKVDELTPVEDREREYQLVSGLLKELRPTCSFEKRCIRKDRTMVWVNLTVSFVSNIQGGAKFFIGVVEDITARKELEAELRQAQKMEAVGLLAGGVAHDFNNVLHAIQGYTSMALLDLNEEHKAYRYIKEAEMAGERATSLVRQLLTLSRKKVLQRSAIDLEALVANLVRMLSRVLGEHIEVQIDCAPDLAFIYADPGQVEQILMNLCINARDAMPEGGKITIEVRNATLDKAYVAAHPRSHEGNYVLLSVTDSGEGMPPEVLDHIFEPFFTTKDGSHGTGMGLAIVYGIVDQHNGTIDVRSLAGEGTEFRVYLPVAAITQNAEMPPKNQSMTGGTETILLAEDDELVRTLNEQVLQTAGYKLIVAKDGEEAIAAFDRHRDSIEMALLDVVMPKKNGRVVFDHMKQIKPDLRVLFSSGYSFDMLGGVLSGLDHDLLHKPYTPFDLLSRVREVLDR